MLVIGIVAVLLYLVVSTLLRRLSVPGGGEGRWAGWEGHIKRLSRRMRQDSNQLRLQKFCPIGEGWGDGDAPWLAVIHPLFPS